MTERSVVAEINLPVESKTGLEMFTKHEHLKAWWQVTRSYIVLDPGGGYTLSWQEDEKRISFVTTGIIRDYREGELLEIENLTYCNPAYPILGGMELSVYVTNLDDGCTLRVTQSGYGTGEAWDWYYEAVKEAWPTVLVALHSYVKQVE